MEKDFDFTKFDNFKEHLEAGKVMGHGDARNIIDANAYIDKSWWNVWLSNLSVNMNGNMKACNIGNVRELFGKAPCEDVIVVGAGRSLTHNESNRKRLRKWNQLGVPIIAVDRAYNTLRNAGVMPDIVVTIDAQDKVKDFFDFSDGAKVPAVAINLVASPALFKHLHKHASAVYGFLTANPFSVAMLWAYNEYGKEYACLLPGSVVYTSAIDLAVKMGFKCVASLGNDMIYHTPMEVVEDKAADVPIPVRVYNSERTFVYTKDAFRSAVSHLEKFTIDVEGVRFLNCSHVEGLRIGGWQNCAFSEVRFDVANDLDASIRALAGLRKIEIKECDSEWQSQLPTEFTVPLTA